MFPKIDLEALREKKWIKWFKRIYVLYIFGFFVGFKPSDPYLYVDHLSSPKSFRKDDISEVIYPISTYTHTVVAFFVFLYIEFVDHNFLLIFYCLIGIIESGFLAWTSSFTEAAVAQGFRGTFLAVEIVYFVCNYAQDEASKVSSFSRAAMLSGRAISALISQLIISQEWLHYYELNYVTFAFSVLALPFAFVLEPTVKNFYYENTEKLQDDSKERVSGILSLFKSNFITTFSDKYMVLWCFWSAVTMAGFNHVQTYIQPLWYLDRDKRSYNGAAEGVLALLGCMVAVIGGFMNLGWRFNGNLILAFTSILQGFLLIFASEIDNDILDFLFYVGFGLLHHLILTSIWSEIARNLTTGRFGMVFGMSAFLGAFIETVMVGLVNDKIGFEMTPHDQFMVYGFYHVIVAVAYIVIGLVTWQAKRTIL